jgi:hypothetical protein
MTRSQVVAFINDCIGIASQQLKLILVEGDIAYRLVDILVVK